MIFLVPRSLTNPRTVSCSETYASSCACMPKKGMLQPAPVAAISAFHT